MNERLEYAERMLAHANAYHTVSATHLRECASRLYTMESEIDSLRSALEDAREQLITTVAARMTICIDPLTRSPVDGAQILAQNAARAALGGKIPVPEAEYHRLLRVDRVAKQHAVQGSMLHADLMRLEEPR